MIPLHPFSENGMPLFRQFLDLFRPEDPPAADPQAYREAFVDLLVWTMYVDRHLALAEREVLDEAARELDWQGVASLEDFVRESTARARRVIDGETNGAVYLQEIAGKIVHADDRRRLLSACETLVRSDDKLRPEEVHHLKAVARAFDL